MAPFLLFTLCCFSCGLDLGQSAVVALTIDRAQAKYSLAALTEDDDVWKRSLNFVAQGRQHFLFECAPGLPRLRGYLARHWNQPTTTT